MKRYIHYGDSVYYPEKVTIPLESVSAKPDRGLWGSPVDAEWGWKDWCDSEQFYKGDMSQHFEFSVKESAKILQVHREQDIIPYVLIDRNMSSYRGMFGTYTQLCDYLDRESLYSHFDGIELFLSDDYTMHNGIFNLWDCDSIVVWNPDVIVAL